MDRTYRFLLRMPEELRVRLKAAADRKGTSLNSEIVSRLEATFTPPPEPPRRKPPWSTRRLLVVPVVVALAAVLAALAGQLTGSSSSAAPLASNELLGARANAFAHLGRSESGEAETQSVAQMDYENRAYPLDAIDYNQTLAAIAAGKRVHNRGVTSPKRWEQVGDGTVNVDTLGTQSFLRPTQWSGRISALAVDFKHCDTSSCSLYIGAAGGGVWKTDDALAPTPHWKELNDGLDSLSIGSLLIDPTDTSGKTLYVGTGESNGASENEAGLGLYRSTNRGKDWSLVDGSVPVAKDRAIGAVAVDPADASHLFIGTAVARHGASATFGGRFTPPGAQPVGLYESTDGGRTFKAALSRPSDVVNPSSPNAHAVRCAVDAYLHRRARSGRPRYPLPALRHEPRQRQDARLPRRGLERGRRARRARRRLEALPHRRRRGRDLERELDPALEQRRRDTRLQLVRLLPHAVLVRHG